MSPATLAHAVLAGLANGAVYALLALPFAIMLALTRALNLAHGELVVLGGYVGYAAGQTWGLGPALAAPLAAAALVPVGLIWRALLGRAREPVEANTLVLTFGLALLLQDAVLAAWSSDYRLIPTGTGPPTAGPLPGLSRERAVAAGLSLLVFLGLQIFLARTRWGLALRATSRDAEAAALMGVNVDRVGAATFAVAAALAGGGGVLFGTLHYLHPTAGVELTFLAVVLAILGAVWGGTGDGARGGGAGWLSGMLVAGLAVGLVESLILAWAGPRWREPVVVGLLLAVLLARPRGLLAPGTRA